MNLDFTNGITCGQAVALPGGVQSRLEPSQISFMEVNSLICFETYWIHLEYSKISGTNFLVLQCLHFSHFCFYFYFFG